MKRKELQNIVRTVGKDPERWTALAELASDWYASDDLGAGRAVDKLKSMNVDMRGRICDMICRCIGHIGPTASEWDRWVSTDVDDSYVIVPMLDTMDAMGLLAVLAME